MKVLFLSVSCQYILIDFSAVITDYLPAMRIRSVLAIKGCSEQT